MVRFLMSWMEESEERKDEVECKPDKVESSVSVKASPPIAVSSSAVSQPRDSSLDFLDESGVEVADVPDVPVSSVESAVVPKFDLDKALSGDSDSSTAVVKTFVTPDESLPMKGNINNAAAFTSVQTVADYSELKSLPNRAVFRRKICRWAVMYGVSLKGKRAEQVLNSLNVEINKQFEIDKRKGLEKML